MEQDTGFRRILLATDGSAQAEAAVESAIELARFSQAVVRVAHVWNLEVHHRHGFWDVEVRSEAERLVQQTVDRLTSAGVAADKEIFRADSGHVAAAIATIAREYSADLVIIGSRGLSDWRSIFEHSVSREVLAALDCPVLIVRGSPVGAAVPTRRILMAVAGGSDVAPAVRAAAAVARPGHGSVMVVHVSQAVLGVQGFAYLESEQEIQGTLDQAIKQLADAGVTAEGMVVKSGPVARAVAQVAADWGAELIVTGSARMGGLASLMLGSVSHDLLRTTEVPVLVAERPKA
jgi:nucleotide-binding universal stress UspA family protein